MGMKPIGETERKSAAVGLRVDGKNTRCRVAAARAEIGAGAGCPFFDDGEERFRSV